MSEKSIAAGEFKSRCLKLLDRVADTGEALVVTKRGRPVARVVPVAPLAESSLRGSVTVHGDIVGSLIDDWELDR